MELNILTICYLIGSVTFIIGLKMLSNPATARKGNLVAAAGMVIAILGTIFLYEEGGYKLKNYGWFFGGILIGSIIGTLAAKKVKMTAMPEMVSIFNGMGGACAALISIVEFNHLLYSPTIAAQVSMNNNIGAENVEMGLWYSAGHVLIILLGLIIGTVSFAGSIIAWGKLNGRVKDYSFKGQHFFNVGMLILLMGLTAFLIIQLPHAVRVNVSIEPLAMKIFPAPWVSPLFYGIFLLAIVYGVLFVLPIGGADMPVVISLLNSFTGVAAACGGFLYNNKVMLTGGILVGAAGTLLTILMCRAMNRSLKNVLIGSFGGGAAASGAKKDQGAYKEITLSDTAVVMSYANKVMIVPGYGLAVAQAQHACH